MKESFRILLNQGSSPLLEFQVFEDYVKLSYALHPLENYQHFGYSPALSEVYSVSIGSKRCSYCSVANNLRNLICLGVEEVHSMPPLRRVFACIS